MRPTRDRGGVAVLAGALLAALAGCAGTEFVVQRYPPFETADIKTVAVVPFENVTGQVGAGTVVADRLAEHLTLNGTYKVLGPGQVRGLVTESEWERDPLGRQEAVLAHLKDKRLADALIVGRVLAYGALQSSYVDYAHERVHLGYGARRGHWGVGWSFVVPDVRFVSQAQVALEAKMLRVVDGSVLTATPAPVTAAVEVESGWPPVPAVVMRDAVERAVTRLLPQFAVVPATVRVRSDKDLKTAGGREEDGDWDYDKSFRLADAGVFVVVRLPAAADRNAFRLTIAPKDREDDAVVTETFVWSGEEHWKAFRYVPRELAAKYGPGTYAVKVFAGEKRVLKHTFKLKA